MSSLFVKSRMHLEKLYVSKFPCGRVIYTRWKVKWKDRKTSYERIYVKVIYSLSGHIFYKWSNRESCQ
jgi:hypothetical protein